MFPRFAPVLLSTLAVLAVSACSGIASADPASPGARVTVQPALTPVPTSVSTPAAEPTPTPSLNAGGVDGAARGPELTVEFPRADLLDVTLRDPDAKAWRLVVAGTGALATDRLEIVVETGDVGPAITVTEVQQGEVVSVMDLTGYLDGTAAAGGCHGTLPVCIDSSGFRLPADGDGRFTVRLQVPDPTTPLVMTGGAAGWPSEPFVLGPWTDTESFQTQ